MNGYVGGTDDFKVWLAKMVASNEKKEEIIIQI